MGALSSVYLLFLRGDPEPGVSAYVHGRQGAKKEKKEKKDGGWNAKKTLGTITEGDERITAFLWIIELRSSLLENINGTRLLLPFSLFLSFSVHPLRSKLTPSHYVFRVLVPWKSGALDIAAYCRLIRNLESIKCTLIFLLIPFSLLGVVPSIQMIETMFLVILLFLERALKNCTSFPGILCAITLYFKSFWDL